MDCRAPASHDHEMETVRTPPDLDVRMRPVVLDTGPRRGTTAWQGQAARVVLGVAIATVLAAGAIAAGGWSLMTAAVGGTPANQPSPLWYPTPLPSDASGASAPPFDATTR
jgi:hypothetical protein